MRSRRPNEQRISTTSEGFQSFSAGIPVSFASPLSRVIRVTVPMARNSSVKEVSMTTYSPKASEITRQWHVIDAQGLVLGRLSTEVARVLRGKHKPTFAPHMDTGDHVIVINADKVVLTSGKADTHMVHNYSGYPGGLRSETYGNLLQRRPADAIRRTVSGMLPKGPLGRQMIKKLKVYAGPEHPHTAQNPSVLTVDHAKAR
jgi:large subunit ribosomal protein L13